MSDRPLAKFKVITNGDMSGNINGKASIIPRLSMMSYGFSWAGTSPVGTVGVQVSNDYEENIDGSVRVAGTWNTLVLNLNGTQVTSIPVTGNTGNGLIDIFQTGAFAARPIFTFTSGVGSLQCIFNAKVS